MSGDSRARSCGTMHCCTGNQKTSAEDEKDLVSYLTAVFGPNSVLPASPADDPRYQATVKPISDEALNIVYVEYELPGPDRMPWSATPDGKGNVWLPYKSDQNKIARVNIDTGVVTEYRVPFKGVAQIHSVFPAADGGVWLAESNGPPNLGRWDPKTEVITEYPDTGGKHTVRSRPDGLVCASGRLSLFDPKTNEYTHFDSAPNAYGVVFDNDGNCWFTQYGKSGKIGRIDVKTKQVKMWTSPTQDAGRFSYNRRIQVDKNGIVWFSESEANQIGRFDPKTETFKEFRAAGPDGDALRDEPRQGRVRLVLLRVHGRLRPHGPQHRQDDRVPVPALREFQPGILPRRSGSQLVRDAVQQQGGLLLPGAAPLARARFCDSSGGVPGDVSAPGTLSAGPLPASCYFVVICFCGLSAGLM